MNGVPMAPHGLTFGQNEAYRLQEDFKTLLGPPGPVFGPKTAAKIKNINNPDLFEKNGPPAPPAPPGSAAWAELLLF